jgi:predicted transcriptional regulator
MLSLRVRSVALSWLAAEAIALYVEDQSWQINKIEQALEIVNSSQAKWVDGEDVETRLNSWETDYGNLYSTTRNDNITISNFP